MKFLEAVGVLTTTTEKTFNPLRAFAICCKVKRAAEEKRRDDVFLFAQIWNHADVLYKFVRDRQDGTDLDLDFDVEQNAGRTGTPAGKGRAKSSGSNAADSPSTSLPMEKKEFDYDFVRSAAFLSFSPHAFALQANAILNSYVCGQLTNGIKFQVALTILDSALEVGDKVLIFR